MGWTLQELEALPASLYGELVAWVNDARQG